MSPSNILSISDLPPEKLPEFWNDDARINALYAPFRDRAVNARDWDCKLEFWKSLISTWAQFNKISVFSEVELKQWFVKNNRVPACISIVLNEMFNNQELQTVDKFMEAPQKSWSGWAVDLTIKRPLKWSFNKVKSTFVAPVNANTKLVHLPTIKYLSNALLRAMPENKCNQLLTVQDVLLLTKFTDVDPETVQLILHYLQCQDKIDSIQNPCTDEDLEIKPILIKFATPNTNKVAPICEVDIAKYKLDSNEKLLLEKIEKLEHEKTEATKSAKQYVAKGMRQMAKNCLRKQHELERRIDKQVTVLENVQTLIERIGGAESDSQVLQSYKSGLSALKGVFKDNGLTEDAVSDTMLEMTDTLENHDDIQAVMSQTVSSINDLELEEELAELLNEPSQPPINPASPPKGGGKENIPVTPTLEERLKNLKFPSVPRELPSTRSPALS